MEHHTATPETDEHPKVVILQRASEHRVEVLHLPEVCGIGTSFTYRGQWWTVTGYRTHGRVLICRLSEPVAH